VHSHVWFINPGFTDGKTRAILLQGDREDTKLKQVHGPATQSVNLSCTWLKALKFFRDWSSTAKHLPSMCEVLVQSPVPQKHPAPHTHINFFLTNTGIYGVEWKELFCCGLVEEHRMDFYSLTIRGTCVARYEKHSIDRFLA
jgi:hypothetical protein